VINHYNVQPVFDIYANVQDRDLGGVAREVDRIIEEFKPKLPTGSFLVVRGQVESMRSAFLGLGGGVLFAIILVYCLMVINFQSWLDPFIIIMALPGALSGILWMLFVTQTTFNVPSLMGAMMSMGVATANSILLVTFANEQRQAGKDAIQAALVAGYTRLRPVLMTALAMIIGMLPMSLGLGEGGEQNAPLGRAVIGGLTVATFATLFFVPIVYSILRRKQPQHVDIEEVALYREKTSTLDMSPQLN
jgi:multidrug efflux pump subunit AcrB